MGFDLLSRFRKRSPDDPPPVESWPVHAFGKLPVYKDFISAGLTDDACREFRDWLSNGFSRHWSTREEWRGAEIPLHAFLLRLPESRKVAVGALWGSRDQGGLRKFPFAIFSVIAPGKPEASALAALDYLPVFESRAREIRRRYEAGGSFTDVQKELRGARIEVPVRTADQIRARLVESLSTPRVGPLARALFGEKAEERWPAFVAGLDGAARRAGDGAGAFRVPLADDPAPLKQLELWTLRLTRASPARTGPLGILYRTGGEVACGVVFYRDLKPEDILLLHPAAAPTDFVEEIPPLVRPETRPEPEAGPDPGLPVEAPISPAEAAPVADSPPPPSPLPPEAPPSSSETGPTPEAAAGRPAEAPPEEISATVPAEEASAPPAVPPAPEAAEPAPPPHAEPPPEPPSRPEPEGWDLPLAALLDRD